MPKRTYPDQDGLQMCGAGTGFVNMRPLYPKFMKSQHFRVVALQ
jgi:hypothetical protein